MQDNDVNNQRRVDLLDLTVLAAENWKFLILVPLLAGAVVFALFKVAGTQSYQTDAVLRLNAEEVELFKSARVLDPVLTGTDWLAKYGNSVTRARTQLLQALTVTKVEDTPFYRISLTARKPEEANDLLSKMITELMKQSVPTGENREEMVEEIAAGKEALNTLKGSLSQLTTVLDKPSASSSNWTAGDIGQSVVSLVTSVEQRRQRLASTERSLNGTVDRDDVIQPPTLPDSGTTPRQITIIAFVMLMAGLATFAAVALKEVLRRSFESEGNADRVARIKKALSFKRTA